MICAAQKPADLLALSRLNDFTCFKISFGMPNLTRWPPMWMISLSVSCCGVKGENGVGGSTPASFEGPWGGVMA